MKHYLLNVALCLVIFSAPLKSYAQLLQLNCIVDVANNSGGMFKFNRDRLEIYPQQKIFIEINTSNKNRITYSLLSPPEILNDSIYSLDKDRYDNNINKIISTFNPDMIDVVFQTSSSNEYRQQLTIDRYNGRITHLVSYYAESALNVYFYHGVCVSFGRKF